MKKTSFWLLIGFFLNLFITNNLSAKESSFFDRKAEGWFWYKEEPKEEPKEDIPPIPVISQQSNKKVDKDDTPETFLPLPPAVFSSEWFRVNLPKYKDIAWDKPSYENVRAYLILQRIAIDRSEKFSNVVEQVTLGDPLLDEVARRPSATFATQQMDKDAAKAKSEVLRKLSSSVGIFYFFKSECELCDLQAPIVKMIENQFNFVIQPISMDGNPLTNNDFPNFKVDQGHAQLLEISTFPALVLADTNGHFSTISQGVVSLNELVQRILIAALRENWITEEDLNQTKAINFALTPEALITINPEQMKDDNFIAPNDLLKLIDTKSEY